VWRFADEYGKERLERWETREFINVTEEAVFRECHNDTEVIREGNFTSNHTFEVCEDVTRNVTEEKTVLKVAGRFKAYDKLNLLIIHHAGHMVARDMPEVVSHMLKEFIDNNG
jgi:hypothetical protein